MGSCISMPSYATVKTFLADHACGTADIERLFGVRYSDVDRESLESGVPFPESMLRRLARSHVLFPGFPLSIIEMRERFPAEFYASTNGWFCNALFANDERVCPRWHLMERRPTHGSCDKNFTFQHLLLDLNFTSCVPRACDLVFMLLAQYKLYGRRFLEHRLVRCSSTTSNEDHVAIGHYQQWGLGICSFDDLVANPILGLASQQNPH